MSFYKYLIGRLYSWAMKREGDTPIVNVILTMCIVHYFQAFTFYIILRRIFYYPDFIQQVNKLHLGFSLIIFFIVYYFLVFRQEKWDQYARFVETEDDYRRKKGNLLVLLYLIGSIALFFVSLPFVLKKTS